MLTISNKYTCIPTHYKVRQEKGFFSELIIGELTDYAFLIHDLLTLGVHAQRGLQYLVCVCVSVCVCVCVSVTQFLTFNVIIRATNDSNLLSGG